MKRVQDFLNSIGLKEPVQIVPIAQEASDRKFYRIILPKESLVLMEVVNPHPIVEAPVKIYHSSDDELPYVNISRYLAKIGVPVPNLIKVDNDNVFILMQDLGKRLLSDVVAQKPELAKTLYVKAIEILVGLQASSARNPDSECFAFQMEFGYPIIRWELEHFISFGIEARVGSLPDRVRAKLNFELDSLAKMVDEIPKTLMLRDYHARNLVVSDDGELGVTDFQDALLGPETYDLASLLFDVYIDLDEAIKKELIQHYLSLRASSGLPPRDFFQFYEQIKLTALQRLLKVIGRFVYLAQRKNKPKFLEHLPKASSSALCLLEDLPQLEGLKMLVKPYLEGGGR